MNAAEFPHQHYLGPCVVVIYGDDMAERVVGPFESGILGEAWISQQSPPLAWAEVKPLDDPNGGEPNTILPPEPPGDDPIPCGDCGQVHGPDEDCP